MNDVQARLAKCFLAVFPDLNPAEIVHSAANTVTGWDSVATVTLLTLIEEEFRLRIDVADLDQFTSFENLQDYLGRRLQAGAATARN